MAGTLPLIGLPADTRTVEDFTYHQCDGKYARAVHDVAGGFPVVIPALEEIDAEEAIAHLDGVVITGAVSNVHPTRYGAEPGPHTEPHDQARDATSLALISAALAANVPLLAICRGIQELNVALGGTLHAEVHEIENRFDHRDPKHSDMLERYGPRHDVALAPGGVLAQITGKSTIMVNSLHRQAIAEIAPGLAVEATASDGTIEAVRILGASSFALGLQWHPEFDAGWNPDSAAIFRAFGAAAREHALKRAAA